jgi:LemA protein
LLKIFKGGIMAGIITLSVLGFLIVLLVIWVIATYNRFISLKNNIDEAFSTMDVYLKKRYDLIPNLVSTVKGYAKHEKETLERVIAARNMAMNSQNMEEKVANENALSGTLKSLFAISESYPELKADKNFMDLQESLKNIESEIASSRKYYNGVVKTYNTLREKFPSNIIANMFKFEKRPLFEIENKEERQNVKVEF